MIGRISGILIKSDFNEALVDVNGVGYQLSIPMSTYDKLPQPGGKVVLLTHLNVREDALDLYGFATEEEKELFMMLRTVSGIGPKVALNIISSMSIETFCSAVADGNVKIITGLKGVGKKTAERLVLELKSKISSISPAAGLKQQESTLSSEVSKAAEEAGMALGNLGIKQETALQHIHSAAKKLTPKKCSTENLIKEAFSSINSR
jgi:Holliday junction DNA helicase RuvA